MFTWSVTRMETTEVKEEMTEKEKRPFIEECKARKEQWEAENASILAELRAVKESGKMVMGHMGDMGKMALLCF